MQLSSLSFQDGAAIPGRFAFAVIDPSQHVRLSENLNPQFSWSNLPSGARSLALVCCDPDAPASGELVNQEGKTVPRDFPRADFYHWLLLDIPVDGAGIEEGSHSRGIVAGGKAGPEVAQGLRHGVNDYTGWFAGDPDMGGSYYGYDGPCPPWNDERAHRYVFTLYALDVASLEVQGELTPAAVLPAIRRHALAQTSLTGWYALNPALAR